MEWSDINNDICYNHQMETIIAVFEVMAVMIIVLLTVIVVILWQKLHDIELQLMKLFEKD